MRTNILIIIPFSFYFSLKKELMYYKIQQISNCYNLWMVGVWAFVSDWEDGQKALAFGWNGDGWRKETNLVGEVLTFQTLRMTFGLLI